MRVFVCILTIALSGRAGFATELRATDFGVKADGKTDDGPAILRMVLAARQKNGKPVRLVFPKNKVIHAGTGKGRYLFPLQHTKNVMIDGGGSTFLLDTHIRMVDLNFAHKPVLKNFNVDYTLSMFIETIVQAVDPKHQYVDVKVLNSAEAKNLGGPTKQDGEQWFGGFVWCENGEHPKAARHYNVKNIAQLPNGQVRIFHGRGAMARQIADNTKPGVTRFSVPRPAVAQRHGPGALFKIHDTVDARLENISVWGAPWFAFSIYRCEGACSFINVDVVPKPGTNRLMGACRDAFHVTGNRAKLIFDGCDTSGIGDDDYNFCILSSAVKKVISQTRIVIRQKYPIQYNPMRVGETLMVMNNDNSVIGSARIASYVAKPLQNGDSIVPGKRCPEVTITLKNPIQGLKRGLTVWAKEAGNPDTTMRNCTAAFSIRMQTSLKIDYCKFVCYNVSYGMSPRHRNVEGPGPGFMRITNSEFHTGRGAGYVAKCGGAGPFERTRIQNIHIENCIFRAPLRITKARSITLLKNKFYDDVMIGKYETLKMSGNTRKNKPFHLESPRGTNP